MSHVIANCGVLRGSSPPIIVSISQPSGNAKLVAGDLMNHDRSEDSEASVGPSPEPADLPGEEGVEYEIVWKGGAVVRASKDTMSLKIGIVASRSIVSVTEVVGRRARIIKPFEGWLSLKKASGVPIAQKYLAPSVQAYMKSNDEEVVSVEAENLSEEKGDDKKKDKVILSHSEQTRTSAPCELGRSTEKGNRSDMARRLSGPMERSLSSQRTRAPHTYSNLFSEFLNSLQEKTSLLLESPLSPLTFGPNFEGGGQPTPVLDKEGILDEGKMEGFEGCGAEELLNTLKEEPDVLVVDDSSSDDVPVDVVDIGIHPSMERLSSTGMRSKSSVKSPRSRSTYYRRVSSRTQRRNMATPVVSGEGYESKTDPSFFSALNLRMGSTSTPTTVTRKKSGGKSNKRTSNYFSMRALSSPKNISSDFQSRNARKFFAIPPPVQSWIFGTPCIFENYFAKPRRRQETTSEGIVKAISASSFVADRPCDRWKLLNNYGFPLDDELRGSLFDSSMKIQTPSPHLWHAVVDGWAKAGFHPHLKFSGKKRRTKIRTIRNVSLPGSQPPPPSPSIIPGKTPPAPTHYPESPPVSSNPEAKQTESASSSIFHPSPSRNPDSGPQRASKNLQGPRKVIRLPPVAPRKGRKTSGEVSEEVPRVDPLGYLGESYEETAEVVVEESQKVLEKVQTARKEKKRDVEDTNMGEEPAGADTIKLQTDTSATTIEEPSSQPNPQPESQPEHPKPNSTLPIAQSASTSILNPPGFSSSVAPARASPTRVGERSKNQEADEKEGGAEVLKSSKSMKRLSETSALAKGIADLGKDIALGVGGVIIDPIRGARRGGVQGFFDGLGSGLVGFVSRPSQGLANLVGSMDRQGRKMPPTTAHQKLCRLILKGRFPDQLREELWLSTSGASQLRLKLGRGYYHEKLGECRDMLAAAKAAGSRPPSPMGRQARVAHEIVKDLGRTFPSHPLFEENPGKEPASGIAELRSILSAFSRHRPDIGYCQCFNYIGAALLLVCEPENAFWMMCALVEGVMPEDYFSDTLIGAITDSMVLQTLVSRKLPTILKQVRKLDASLSAPCLQWFVCLFITVLPIHITIRIWDLVLVHGSHTLFWVALAMLHLSQKRILEAKNEGELFAIMTTIAEELDDERVLMKAVAKFKIPKSTIVSLQEIERKALDHRMREVKSSDKNKSIRDAKNAESTRPTLQNNSKSNVSADDSNSYDPSATEDADISDADSTSYHAGEVEPGFEDVEEVNI